MKKNLARVGFAAAAVAAAFAVGGATQASAISVTPYPDGTVQYNPSGGEWWACASGSLAAPYVALQAPQTGPAPQFARFTPGIDVAVACWGTQTKHQGF
ncbi:MAG: hypothetical protein HOQ24_13380, partial [Mycobacteriaceae bacterium]|nr:hypothetical protein [Mycobacteriaceae bacterium]